MKNSILATLMTLSFAPVLFAGGRASRFEANSMYTTMRTILYSRITVSKMDPRLASIITPADIELHIQNELSETGQKIPEEAIRQMVVRVIYSDTFLAAYNQNSRSDFGVHPRLRFPEAPVQTVMNAILSFGDTKLLSIEAIADRAVISRHLAEAIIYSPGYEELRERMFAKGEFRPGIFLKTEHEFRTQIRKIAAHLGITPEEAVTTEAGRVFEAFLGGTSTVRAAREARQGTQEELFSREEKSREPVPGSTLDAAREASRVTEKRPPHPPGR
jgi:hypothetical protein